VEPISNRAHVQHQYLLCRNASLFGEGPFANSNLANCETLEHHWTTRDPSLGHQPQRYYGITLDGWRLLPGLLSQQHLALLHHGMDAHATGSSPNQVTAISKNVYCYGLFQTILCLSRQILEKGYTDQVYARLSKKEDTQELI
jgi:hypothetical protein